MSSTTIHSAKDILNSDGDLPDDVLLGRIVLFKITDEAIGRSDLVQWFGELNLDLALLPPEIKPIDAFKKATSEAKAKYDIGNGQTVEILCRDVVENSEYVKRQITREVKDRKAVQLDYTRAIDCVFYRARSEKTKVTDANGKTSTVSQTVKGTERLRVTVNRPVIAPEEWPVMDAIAGEIQTRYQRYYAFLDGNRLRAVVRDYLNHLSAIELKGGVYFIHVSHSDELKRLQTLVSRFGGGCMMHTIPLVDIEEQRKFVTIAFEREAAQALADIARECDRLRTERKSITPAAFAKIKDRYDLVMDTAGKHMVTLQVSQDLTGAAADVALTSLLALGEEMLEA